MTRRPKKPSDAAQADIAAQRLDDLTRAPNNAPSMWGNGAVILRLPYGPRSIDETSDHLVPDLFDVCLTRQTTWQDRSSRQSWEQPVAWWRERFQTLSARPLFLHDNGDPMYFNEVKVRRYIDSFYEVAIKLVRAEADLAVSTDESSRTYMAHQVAQHAATLERAHRYTCDCLRAAVQDPARVYRGEGRWSAWIPGPECARAMPRPRATPAMPDPDELLRMRRYTAFG